MNILNIFICIQKNNRQTTKVKMMLMSEPLIWARIYSVSYNNRV